MRLVAVISQPLRANHCRAYVTDQIAGSEAVILTANAAAFAGIDIPDGVEVTETNPKLDLLPTGRLMASRLTRRGINWARSGSQIGLRIERLIKSVLWRMRYLDRVTIVLRTRRNGRAVAALDINNSPIATALERLHAEEPISRIVVFDVFDLPASLQVAKKHGIEILVR